MEMNYISYLPFFLLISYFLPYMSPKYFLVLLLKKFLRGTTSITLSPSRIVLKKTLYLPHLSILTRRDYFAHTLISPSYYITPSLLSISFRKYLLTFPPLLSFITFSNDNRSKYFSSTLSSFSRFRVQCVFIPCLLQSS